jgi:hypothetical protein
MGVSGTNPTLEKIAESTDPNPPWQKAIKGDAAAGSFSVCLEGRVGMAISNFRGR